MQDATVLLPITCPQCGLESLVEFPVIVVVAALTRWNQMALHAGCHDGSWNASPAELARIRSHVGESWIHSHASQGQGGVA